MTCPNSDNWNGEGGELDFVELVCRYVDDQLSADELSLLNDCLRNDAGCRETFVRYCMQGKFLAEALAVGASSDAVEAEPILPLDLGEIIPANSAWPGVLGFFSQGMPFAYLVAALLVGLAMFVGSLIPVSSPKHIAGNLPRPNLNPTTPAADSVAQITGTIDCRWRRKGLGIRDWGLEGMQNENCKLQNANLAKVQGPRFKVQDKKISKSRNPQIPQSLIYLGDQLVLSAGMMQITYHTGAKVILQGPCTYQVDSPNGGFLSIGKLTARVESSTEQVASEGMQNEKCKLQNAKLGVASGQWLVASEYRNPEIPKSPNPSLSTNHYPLSTHSNPQSLIPNPLFAVRTPTATITDLGTEFGVAVDERGGTKSHVFQGSVEVRPAGTEGSAGKPIVLLENQSVRIEQGQGEPLMVVQRDEFDPAVFVRAGQIRELIQEKKLEPLRRWQAYSAELQKDPALVAYYTFDAADDGDTSVLKNLSAAGKTLDARVSGAEWTDGRMAGKYALHFHGPYSGDRVELPDGARFNFDGPFSLAIWFKILRFTQEHQALIAKGDESWRLQQGSDADRNRLVFCTNSDARTIHRLTGKTEVNDGRWHFCTVVYEPTGGGSRQRLYIDGKLDAELVAPLPLQSNDKPVWLGANSEQSDRELNGWIDEAAIFRRALSADEVAAMYQAGNGAK